MHWRRFTLVGICLADLTHACYRRRIAHKRDVQIGPPITGCFPVKIHIHPNGGWRLWWAVHRAEQLRDVDRDVNVIRVTAIDLLVDSQTAVGDSSYLSVRYTFVLNVVLFLQFFRLTISSDIPYNSVSFASKSLLLYFIRLVEIIECIHSL